MSVASLSLFRFAGLQDKLWAFNQMLLARRPLARIPDIAFCKLLGTGTQEGFHPYPNFAVCGILAVWPTLEIGRERIARSHVFDAYRSRAVEDWTVYLGPVQSRGGWDGATPFAPERRQPGGSRPGDRPVVVLTRATIRPRHVLAFWRQVPDIARTTRAQDGLDFKIGLGEVPWFHQVTFTVWRDLAAMEAFAFTGFHRAAIAKVHEGGWFSEALFARFDLLHSEGRWIDAPGLTEPAPMLMSGDEAVAVRGPAQAARVASGLDGEMVSKA